MSMKHLFFTILILSGGSAQNMVTIPAGTPVLLSATRTLSSGVDRQGDAVNFELTEGVASSGVIVIAKGAMVAGTISTATPAGDGRKGGALQIKLKDIRLPSGASLALGLKQPGTVPPATAVTTAGVLPTTLIPGGNATLSIQGRSNEAVVVRGYLLTAYVQKTVVLDANKLSTSPTPPVEPETLTNRHIVGMFQTGRTEDEIVTAIKSSPGAYQVAAADIAALKKAGLTSRIIEAMMRVAAGQ